MINRRYDALFSFAFIFSDVIANEPDPGGRRPSVGDDERRKDPQPPSSSNIDQPAPVVVSSRPTEAGTVPSTDADRPVNKRVAAETKELFDDFFATKKKKAMSLKPDCTPFPLCKIDVV